MRVFPKSSPLRRCDEVDFLNSVSINLSLDLIEAEVAREDDTQ